MTLHEDRMPQKSASLKHVLHSNRLTRLLLWAEIHTVQGHYCRVPSMHIWVAAVGQEHAV